MTDETRGLAALAERVEAGRNAIVQAVLPIVMEGRRNNTAAIKTVDAIASAIFTPLQAAAPDLLAAHLAWEAAEDARNDCNDPLDGCDNEGPWEACPLCSVRFGKAIDMRRAAIAKAEGRTARALSGTGESR